MWEVDTGNINNFLYIYFQKRCKDVGQQLVGDVIQRASFFKLHGQHVCFHPDWTETIKETWEWMRKNWNNDVLEKVRFDIKWIGAQGNNQKLNLSSRGKN